MIGKVSALVVLSALLMATSAQADVEISKQPTANISCVSRVCSPTASKAVLNVGDLETMLASGDVTVNTGGSLAKDIDIDQPLTWASTSRLTLDAYQSVSVKKPVSVTGTGALTITTNDGGKNGEFVIVPERGSVQFWDLGSSLLIDGITYTLVGDIKTLAADIAANPSGLYALAKSYDASVDGTYSTSPIATDFYGTLEGLGNVISNFTLRVGSGSGSGLFTTIRVSGRVRDLGLDTVNVEGGNYFEVASLAGGSEGTIEACWATGKVTNSSNSISGLVAVNGGTVSRSFARVDVAADSVRRAGGLVAYNAGLISQSYATGRVKTWLGLETDAGGLVGYNEAGDGQILNSYTLGTVHDGQGNCCEFGGLVGENGDGATITGAYAAGRISKNAQSHGGGLVGDDGSMPGSIANGYWDLDKGISNPAQGAGNIPNDPGITGLSDAQLKSRLPAGFDPGIWGQNSKINDGYPYLLANPPP